MARGQNSASAAALLLLASIVVQSTAMPMHPDLFSFVKLPVSRGAGNELQQTAARRLHQQQQRNDLFREQGGPFTADGFGTGYGGLYPTGGFFDGFGQNVYNIIFRDILNEGLNQYLSNALSNNPLQPFDFIPPEVGDYFNRDVVTLFGYDAVDKFVGQYLTRATAKLGSLIDAGCVGPTYSVTVAGGECEIDEEGAVECSEPTIKFSSTPYTCNLPYRSGAKLEGQSFKYKAEFGRARSGELGLPAGVYNFGAAVNVTTPYLGMSLQTARLANDFGVQQWYQFVGNLILNELLRIQAALLSGAVDSRILTRAAQDAADAKVPRSAIAQGAAELASAGNELLDKIAAAMGINTAELTDGLRAAGVLQGQEAAATAAQAKPQQQQQQQRTAPVDPAVRAASPAPATTVTADITQADEGGNVIIRNTNDQQGNLALLSEPKVKAAEGAQPVGKPGAAAEGAAKASP